LGVSQWKSTLKHCIYKVHQLDSEMQTLVYENYNKFIAATDTIRKMKVDFVDMEAEVAKLTEKIDKIEHFSSKVSEGPLDIFWRLLFYQVPFLTI